MKKLSYSAVFLIFMGLTFIVFVRNGLLDSDLDQALASYGGPPSQFIEIDGALLHYRTEGDGPPLLLLHGSRASLHQWDGWVAALRNQFTIIRVDGAGHGLSGTDPSGDYSPDRQTFLLDALLDHLALESVHMGGTSSGATLSVRYAARYPERVKKLVLSTVPLKLPATRNTSAFRTFIFRFHNEVLKSNATNLYWRNFLESIFADPGKVTDGMVTRYRTLNGLPNRQQQQQARIEKWYELGGPDYDFQLAAKITAPIFVQWGVAGPVLPQHIQCEITTAFKNAEVRVISYPNLGHKLVMEDPVRTARDASAYLNGEEIGGKCRDL